MDFVTAVKTCILERFTDFQGRSARSEFWWFALFFIAGSIITNIIDGIIFAPLIGINLLNLIWTLGLIVPYVAVAIRRMHDLDKTGWFILIPFYNIYLWAQLGTQGDNQFGADPLA